MNTLLIRTPSIIITSFCHTEASAGIQQRILTGMYTIIWDLLHFNNLFCITVGPRLWMHRNAMARML
ncbi:hypothetical protein LI169_21135, partial [Desulfovibrio desulfuricans]|nr:hypothetical protein [Desulfovibrio desulfuricans]